MPVTPADIPTADVQRTRHRVMLVSLLVVVATFIAARLSNGSATSHVFDYFHWTVAYLAASVLAWIGVRAADENDRVPRRWFARGLTVTALAELLFEVQDFTGVTLIPDLTDVLFLTLGPCMVLGLAATFKGHPSIQRKPFVLDVTAMAVVILTLTLDLYLPRSGSISNLDLAILVAYPICMLTPTCVGIVLAPTLRLKPDRRWALLLTAAALNNALWMIWNNGYVINLWQSNSLLNLAFSFVAL